MSDEIIVPTLGESVTEATVSKWLKQVGETVDSDEPLVELETDKVNVEVPSPLSGTLSTISVKEGETVEVGALLGIVQKGESTSKKIDVKEAKTEKSYTPPTKENIKNIKKKENNAGNIYNKQKPLTLVDESQSEKSNATLILDTLAEENNDKNIEVKKDKVEKEYIPPKTKKHLSPSVRKMVQENNINISNVVGTGKSGRIEKGDLIQSMGNIPEPSKRKISHGTEEVVKMSRLRLTIAKRLKEAQDSAAMLTTFNEVDLKNVMQMRNDYQDDFQKKYSVKLGFMSFFVKASVVALKNFPAVNAEINGDNII